MDLNCEFCDELEDFSSSRFGKMYRNVTNSRVVEETENFYAIPTIGQLFEGSMLVLPKQHIETCSGIPVHQQPEFIELVSKISKVVSVNGYPVFFEHGAKCETKGSCGIYHAHLHIVPVPNKIELTDFLPRYDFKSLTLDEILPILSNSSEYLYIGDLNGFVGIDLEASRDVFPSQYFRRTLAEYFGLDKEWDWRKSVVVEPEVLKMC